MYFEIEASWKEVEDLVKTLAKKKLVELELQIYKLETEKNKLRKLANPFWELEEAMKKNNHDHQIAPAPYTPWHPQPLTTPWTYPGTGVTPWPTGPQWTTTTCGTATSGSMSSTSNHSHSINIVSPHTHSGLSSKPQNEIEGQQ